MSVKAVKRSGSEGEARRAAGTLDHPQEPTVVTGVPASVTNT
jgi:hypothetical protein